MLRNDLIEDTMFLLESSKSNDAKLKELKVKRLGESIRALTYRLTVLEEYPSHMIEKMVYTDKLYISVALKTTASKLFFMPETLSFETRIDEKDQTVKYVLLYLDASASVEFDLDEISEIKRVYIELDDEMNQNIYSEEEVWKDEQSILLL